VPYVSSLPLLSDGMVRMLEKISSPAQDLNPQYAWFVSNKKYRFKPLSHSVIAFAIRRQK